VKSWFIASAVTIIAVIGIRWLAGERISYRLRYALWLLVLLRLLIPVNFASSEISVARLMDWEPVIHSTYVNTVSDSFCGALQSESALSADPERVLMSLWLGGAALILSFLAGSGIRIQRKLRRDRILVETGVCPVPVYRTSAVQSPCLVGLFRPVVYVTETEEGETLRHVLLHEMYHLRHFDHLWTVLRCIVLAVHWFDPLVWIAVRLSKRDGELACDEGVLEYLGDAERINYGQTLIQLSCKSGIGGMNMMGNTMLSKKGSLRRRIVAIASGRRTKASMAAVIAVLCLLTAGCTFTDAPETTPPVEITQPQAAEDVYAVYVNKKYNLTHEEAALIDRIPEQVGIIDVDRQVVNGQIMIRSSQLKGFSHAEDARLVDVTALIDTQPDPMEEVQLYELHFRALTAEEAVDDFCFIEFRSEEHCGSTAWTDTFPEELEGRFVYPDA